MILAGTAGCVATLLHDAIMNPAEGEGSCTHTNTQTDKLVVLDRRTFISSQRSVQWKVLQVQCVGRPVRALSLSPLPPGHLPQHVSGGGAQLFSGVQLPQLTTPHNCKCAHEAPFPPNTAYLALSLQPLP